MEVPVLIWLVEDEPLIGFMLGEALEDAGFTAHRFSTGAEALARLSGGGPLPSAIVTDIQLGDGPNGWELAQQARELNPGIPILYISGDSAHEHPARGVSGSIMLPNRLRPTRPWAF